MAVNIVRTCDAKSGCTNEATHVIELRKQGIALHTDICDADVEALMETFAFRPVAALVDGKRRDVYMSATGKSFSTADARAWLIAEGVIAGSGRGRISQDQLDLYASKH